MTQTLAWARTRVSRRVERRGHFYSGTAQTGSTASSLVDTRLTYGSEPNHWASAEILATSGANLDETRIVSASDDGALTFPAFPNAFSAGDTYELRVQYHIADVDGAIGEAVMNTNNRIWVAESGVGTWVDGQETYFLSETMVLLSAVEYIDDDGISHPIRFNHWRCPGNGTVVLDATALGFFTEDTPIITFRGWRYPVVPSASTDEIEAPEAFVVYSAIAALRGEGYSAPATDPDNDAGAFNLFMNYAHAQGRRTPVPPNTKRAR